MKIAPIPFVLAALLALGALPVAARAALKPEKTVWNYDGGVFLVTDGSLEGGPCFRVSGRLTGGGFFDHLKRIDDDQGTRFVRDKTILTQFPDQLSLSFVIYDQPCPAELQSSSARKYLTPEMMNDLRLLLYWKRGVALRLVEKSTIKNISVEKLQPYAKDLAETLPPRFEWKYALEIPSAGVPLTDSLVLMLKTEDGRIAARVAARL